MSMSGADTYRLDEARRAHTHAMRRITNPALKRAGYRWRVAGVERDETGEIMETYWRLHRPDGSPVLDAEQQAEIDRVVEEDDEARPLATVELARYRARVDSILGVKA